MELKHRWTYRGQIVPTNRLVTIEAVITAVDDAARCLKADGFLLVDGKAIYQMLFPDQSISRHERAGRP
jgi:hypothetical protein